MSQAECKVATDTPNELTTMEPSDCFAVWLRTFCYTVMKKDIALLKESDPVDWDHYNETVCDKQMKLERQEWLRQYLLFMGGTARKPTWPG